MSEPSSSRPGLGRWLPRPLTTVLLGVGTLGTPPTEPRARELWVHAAMTVAAYRDRYKVDGDVPLGGGATKTLSGQTVDEHNLRCARRPVCRATPNRRPAARRLSCLPSPLVNRV